MKNLIIFFFSLFILKTAVAQQASANVITSDINNFWAAYDKITATKDSAAQYTYLNQLFLEKGTPGLKAMMQARNYTAKSYIDAINSYPQFWNSIRGNMLKAPTYADQIAVGVGKLKKLYPALRPAKIYFTVGAFRSGGTTLDSLVLIGSEIMFANSTSVTTEFPKSYASLINYFNSNPANIMVFTNVHEYVHTQQKTTNTDILLSQCVMEGVAEFMAEKATGEPSTLPALSYGRAHTERIKEIFTKQMFSPRNGFWLYNDAGGEFAVRDLGYYVGYAICEGYYNKAADKKQAIKEMITLDYNNKPALSQFVDRSGYFAKPVQVYKAAFEASRPVVMDIKPFKNNATNITPVVTQITVEFSAPMNKGNRNFELGPLGKANLLVLKRFIGFAADGRSATFEVDLKPALHYQLVVGAGFLSLDGAPLKPYLIDITTGDK